MSEPISIPPRSRLAGILIVLFFSAWLTACIRQQTQPAPAPIDCPPCPADQRADALVQIQALQQKLAAADAKVAERNRAVADLEIRLLQKQAMMNELQRRTISQQKRLDDAITEVVRSKSKLRSIESKAEAASTIAEAEIALKSLQSRMGETDPKQQEMLRKAESLLKQSTREFNAQNYGGALFLAVQSRNQVSAGDRSRQAGEVADPVAGEVAFDQPLALKLTKNSNLRQGPDISQRVISVLTADTPVVGYAYKENWIRVDTEAGVMGWVHQSLVMAR